MEGKQPWLVVSRPFYIGFCLPETHALRVNTLISPVTPHRFPVDQFRGFSGSSGESQVTAGTFSSSSSRVDLGAELEVDVRGGRPSLVFALILASRRGKRRCLMAGVR